MAEPLRHGGRLREAARRYAIPLERWLDLSTGINPHGWPVPTLPASCWQRLPEEGDGLEAAARACYGSEKLLPVAGSQAAIQLLPRLRAPGRIGVLANSYAEHAEWWRRAGHEVIALEAGDIEAVLDSLDVLLLVNPNNPTGEIYPHQQLLSWRARLAARGGWLLVDEAFIDASPLPSLVPECGDEGLVVLRSMGKFFGLAGIRVGFVAAWPALLDELADALGPWSLSGPARCAARLALEDGEWQARTRARLSAEASRLGELLARYSLPPEGGTALFQWLRHPRAAGIHAGLAGQGILVRLFDAPAALRFGLPGDEPGWQRLQAGLERLARV